MRILAPIVYFAYNRPMHTRQTLEALSNDNLANESVLYFSSDGPSSIGGLDIFKTKYNKADSSWSSPLNMGYPLNTADHEFHLSFLPDGKHGFFSTYRKDTYGEADIYQFEI